MMHIKPKILLAFATVSLLSACSSMPSFERNQPVPVADDDAICSANGVARGSKDYIACRKNRDVQATQGDRMERSHRRMSEDMLNSPSDSGSKPWR